MLMFKPSSSTCRFSSRVPNRVSMFGVISMLFFIQLCWFTSSAVAPLFFFIALIRCRKEDSRTPAWGVPLRIVLRGMRKADYVSVKSLPPGSGRVNEQDYANRVATGITILLRLWPTTEGQTLSVRSRTHPETRLERSGAIAAAGMILG